MADVLALPHKTYVEYLEEIIPSENPFAEYLKEIENSEGFYVMPVIDFPVSPAGILPVVTGNSNDYRYMGAPDVFRDYSKNDDYLKAQDAALFAVHDHKTKMRQFMSFLDIQRLNVSHTAAGIVYYITMNVIHHAPFTRYQAIVQERNSKYEVKLFRLAPYYEEDLDIYEIYSDVVVVHNLLPWMDENYLYYKCFYESREDILGIMVIGDGENTPDEAVVHLRSSEALVKFMNKYDRKLMPATKEKVFELEVNTSTAEELQLH